MSQRQRSHELRLQVEVEADALMFQLGGQAHQAAQRRAREASCDSMARDWSSVAAAIARKTGLRPASLFSLTLH